MHGLANGEIRVNAGDMDVFQSVEGPDSIYPDGVSIDEALRQLDELDVGLSKAVFPGGGNPAATSALWRSGEIFAALPRCPTSADAASSQTCGEDNLACVRANS